jgi:hypothetical protein
MIKITKDLKFGYADLMKEVDKSQKFTLRDLICICVKSSIPMEILHDILRCRYIEDYWKEINKKPFDNHNNIDYLEVFWLGEKSSGDFEDQDRDFWGFRGVGKEGVISKDVIKYCKFTKEQKKTYRESYALEFSKLHTLSDLPLKIKDKLEICNYLNIKSQSGVKIIDYAPSITLVELLHAVFYELSFYGSPEERDQELNDLRARIEDIVKNNVKMFSHKQAKERILKNINRKK